MQLNGEYIIALTTLSQAYQGFINTFPERLRSNINIYGRKISLPIHLAFAWRDYLQSCDLFRFKIIICLSFIADF
jgi:hypothetical protein